MDLPQPENDVEVAPGSGRNGRRAQTQCDEATKEPLFYTVPRTLEPAELPASII